MCNHLAPIDSAKQSESTASAVNPRSCEHIPIHSLSWSLIFPLAQSSYACALVRLLRMVLRPVAAISGSEFETEGDFSFLSLSSFLRSENVLGETEREMKGEEKLEARSPDPAHIFQVQAQQIKECESSKLSHFP
jgi:hypothetical protein